MGAGGGPDRRFPPGGRRRLRLRHRAPAPVQHRQPGPGERGDLGDLDRRPLADDAERRLGACYPLPNVPRPRRQTKPPTGADLFSTLGPEWEWNHNPDNTRWSAGSGLRLQTATVTGDLYSARNTLTHLILGPLSTATIQLDYSGMRDGDRAGLALLRDSSMWIGVKRDNGVAVTVNRFDLTTP
jgi:hypothetical protein